MAAHMITTGSAEAFCGGGSGWVALVAASVTVACYPYSAGKTIVGLASLPRGVSWAGVLLVGCVAGIGFTMALFIGALAFSDPSMLAIAKIAVLVASAIAGAVGLTLGYRFLPRVKPSTNGATTPHEAETD